MIPEFSCSSVADNIRIILWTLLLLFARDVNSQQPDFVATALTKEGEFTPGIEGPACDEAGNIFVVNFEKQQTIGRVTADGIGTTWIQLPGKSTGNGIVFDQQGNMFIADYVGHNVLRVKPDSKQPEVFAHEPAMNQPNDLAIAPNGTLYASDPNWNESTGQLWKISTDGSVDRIADKMGTTNGIEVSPDGKWLYVNESMQRSVWKFSIQADGTLGDKTLIRQIPDFGFDGMRCDATGNLFITRHGKGTVVIMTPTGEVLREVDVLGSKPSNLCFGGPDGKTVYVTEVEHTRLVQFRSDTPGLSWTRWKTIDIGSRREMFVDSFLIDRLDNLSLKLHEPKLAPPMIEPADNLEYGTVIKDGDLFRLYTREGRGAKFDGDKTEVTRYCESHDGIHWTKPKLGLVELDGNKDNNVFLQEAPFCHNFSPMLDSRPGVPTSERFKALAGTVKSMLYAFVSGDGIHWRKMSDSPVIQYAKEYAFDSQNVSFWSESEGSYVCYFRHFLEKKLRSVCRTTSQDFLSWTEPVLMKPNFEGEHLYTTLTHPYFRAPHIYIATPTRFHPSRGESTDILFMTARGNTAFDRTFREAFIRPGLDPNRWGNRSNYAALNVVPTGPTEMSIYTTPFRRFTLRTDGFASVHAGADHGKLATKGFRFSGDELAINFATSAAGSLGIEIQDEHGKTIPGFSSEDCVEIIGDEIDRVVRWKKGSSVRALADRPVKLLISMIDSDLYAIQFR